MQWDNENTSGICKVLYTVVKIYLLFLAIGQWKGFNYHMNNATQFEINISSYLLLPSNKPHTVKLWN